MKPDQEPERTPAREATTTKGRVTPVPAVRPPDDRADENRAETEEVSRREALKGRVDPESAEPAPADQDRDGDRAANADGRASRPAGTRTTARGATDTDTETGTGSDGRGAPADSRTGRAERTGRTERADGATAVGTPGASGVPGPSGSRGSGSRSGSRDTGDSAGPDERMLPLDDHDKFSLRLRHAVGGFIDGPQASVEEADQVLEELAGRFTEAVTRRRRDLRTSWQSGAEGATTGTDTERLRLALRDYREMTERLLRL
ncbi:hypothetical protein ACFV06_31735 [Streptomyces sp. NPDC059618]|uniref:hypothetical protein n=1 Tax=Streptomyces sp. NPDC059618 TaxID=3346887 RepID=UPI0036B9EEF3